MNYSYYNNKSSMPKYNAPILVLLCRDEYHNFKIVYVCDKENLAPEMYVPINEKLIAEHSTLYGRITKVEDGPPSADGEETIRCETTFPYEIGYVERRNFTHTYLGDIKWDKLCIQKIGLKSPYIEVPDTDDWLTVDQIKELPEEEHFFVPIRWIGWDIETNVEPIFPVFNGPKDAEVCDIISITGYDSYTKEYHIFYWHKNVSKNITYLWKDWVRSGDYYVPAIKKTRLYNNNNNVFIHAYTNEIDMLKGYIDWFADIRPDTQFGFFSEGGHRITTRKGRTRKRWINGFDMPYLYLRCKQLKIVDYLQRMSPLPNRVKKVKFRQNGRDYSVQIEGVCQIDFLFTTEIFGYHKKFDGFREGNLQGFMSYFLGFGKVDHKEQIFEMWRNETPSDYDPTDPKKSGVNLRKNYVLELFENAKK